MSDLILILISFGSVATFIYFINRQEKIQPNESDNEIYNYIIQNLDKATLTSSYFTIEINGVLIDIRNKEYLNVDGCTIYGRDITPIVNKHSELHNERRKLKIENICKKLKGETCQS